MTNEEEKTTELVPTGTPSGFLAQPRQHGNTSPALTAEAQRAKSEVESALTIAAARPRDEKAAVDRIMVACQRPGLAEKSQYRYARGGTDITGPTIDLLEVITQKWGNIEYGFRELARFPGENNKPGESIVEAFAWDLESNTRRRTQFSVSHSIGLKGGKNKILTDGRDIYEWIANNAQRRVRTCLENIIPRDVIDIARKECEKTLQANVDVTPEALKKLVEAFAKYGVTRDQIENRIQRRLDTVSPAQVVNLRQIWTILRDGVGQVDDWFEVEKDTDGRRDATEKMRKQPKKTAPPIHEETSISDQDVEHDPPDFNPPSETEQNDARKSLAEEDQAIALGEWCDAIKQSYTVLDVQALEDRAKELPEGVRTKFVEACLTRKSEIRSSRGK